MTAHRRIIYEHWWLMTCDFPDLNWARLRGYHDHSADVFDCDGRTIRFPSIEAARHHLNEDEYTALEDLESDELATLKTVWNDLSPPTGGTDVDLVPQMLQRVKSIREP
jgi:hypothetical protein